MIPWPWLLVAVSVGMCLGVVLAGMLAGAQERMEQAVRMVARHEPHA